MPAAAEADLAEAAAPWHSLTEPLLWQGDEHAATSLAGPTAALAPAWRAMLLSDGSVTRHLQLLTGRATEVECLAMDVLPSEVPDTHLPSGTRERLPGKLLQRQVLLGSAAEPLVYAASWWGAETADRYLQDPSQPIWTNLKRKQMELHREIQEVYLGHSQHLEELLGQPGPFWGRHYTFWHAERPLTVIFEAFSPRLQHHLGATHCTPAGGDAAVRAAVCQQ